MPINVYKIDFIVDLLLLCEKIDLLVCNFFWLSIINNNGDVMSIGRQGYCLAEGGKGFCDVNK